MKARKRSHFRVLRGAYYAVAAALQDAVHWVATEDFETNPVLVHMNKLPAFVSTVREHKSRLDSGVSYVLHCVRVCVDVLAVIGGKGQGRVRLIEVCANGANTSPTPICRLA